MKRPEWFVKYDLYWVTITRDLLKNIEKTADYVDPKKDMAKIALVNNEKELAYIISENKVIPLTQHFFSGTSRNYYTDEPEHYEYYGTSRLLDLLLFDVNEKVADLTSSSNKKTITLEEVLNLEKYQNEYIKQANLKKIEDEKRIAKENIEFEKKLKAELKKQEEVRNNYPKEMQK